MTCLTSRLPRNDDRRSLLSLKDLLRDEADNAYKVTEALFELVGDDELGWKPTTGTNWMSLGQLLMHCATACGSGIKGFVTGDWGLPDGVTFEDLPPEQSLPPAEKMPAADSVQGALAMLRDDRTVAHQFLDEVDEAALVAGKAKAPWG